MLPNGCGTACGIFVRSESSILWTNDLDKVTCNSCQKTEYFRKRWARRTNKRIKAHGNREW